MKIYRIFILCLFVVISINHSSATPPKSPLNVKLTLNPQEKISSSNASFLCEIWCDFKLPQTSLNLEIITGSDIIEQRSPVWEGVPPVGLPLKLTPKISLPKLGNIRVVATAKCVVDEYTSYGATDAVFIYSDANSAREGFFFPKGMSPFSRGECISEEGKSQTYQFEEEDVLDTCLKSQDVPPPPASDPSPSCKDTFPSPAKENDAKGAMVVTGRWTYFNREDVQIGANTFIVELFKEGGTHLAWAYTDWDGYYTFDPIGNPGGKVYTMVRSYVKYNPYNFVLQVCPFGAPNTSYGVYSGLYNAVDGTLDAGYWSVTNGDMNEPAFWIKNDLNRAFKYPDPWQPGGSTVLWDVTSPCWPHYHPGGNIHVPWNIANGTNDKTGSDVILHEYAHNIMFNVYGCMPPHKCPDPHYIFISTGDAGCAWTEGWANFYPLAVNNDKVFNNFDGGYLDLDNQYPGDGRDQGFEVEGRVAGALWDLLDNKAEGMDIYFVPFSFIVNVLNLKPDNFYSFYGGWVTKGYSKDGFLGCALQNTINNFGTRSVFYLTDNNPAISNEVPKIYKFSIVANKWGAIGIAPTVDYDIFTAMNLSFDPYDSSSWVPGTGREFIVNNGHIKGNVEESAIVHYYDNYAAGSYYIEAQWNSAYLSLNNPQNADWEDHDVLDVYETYLQAGKQYKISVNVLSGFIDPALFIFSPDIEHAGRNFAKVQCNNNGWGSEETILYTAPLTGYYGIVVTNEYYASGSYQILVNSYQPLSPNTSAIYSNIPGYFSFPVEYGKWTSLGICPVTDHDLRVSTNSSLDDPYATSALTGNTRDFIVTNGHLWNGTHYAKVDYGSKDYYMIELRNDSSYIGVNVPVMGTFDIDSTLKIHQFYLNAGMLIRAAVSVNSGAANPSLFIYRPTRKAGCRNDADWSAQIYGAGQKESVVFSAPYTGDYAFVVTNDDNISAPSNYTITANLILALGDKTPFTSVVSPADYIFQIKNSEWCGVAISPSVNFNITAADNYNFIYPYTYSNLLGTTRDYIVANGSYWGDTSHYIRLNRISHASGQYTIEAEWTPQHLVVGTPFSGSMNTGEIIDMYQITLEKGHLYFLNVHIASGQPDIAVFLHPPSRDCGTRQYPYLSVNKAGAGGDENLAIQTNESGNYGIALINDNDISGNYTIGVYPPGGTPTPVETPTPTPQPTLTPTPTPTPSPTPSPTPILLLTDDTPGAYNVVPKDFRFKLDKSSWCAVGLNPTAPLDLQALELPNSRIPYASSNMSDTMIDFIVSNGIKWGDALHCARVYNGSNSPYTIKAVWEAKTLVLDKPASSTIDSRNFMKLYQLNLQAQKQYTLRAETIKGDADLAIFIFKPDRTFGFREDANWSSIIKGSRTSDSKEIVLTTDMAGVYGIVLISNKGGGEYILNAMSPPPTPTATPTPTPTPWPSPTPSPTPTQTPIPPICLENDVPETFTEVPKDLCVTINRDGWCGVGINPTARLDIMVAEINNFRYMYASSEEPDSTIDFIMSNGHYWGDDTHFVRISNGDGSPYVIKAEWELRALNLAQPIASSLSSKRFIEVFQAPLSSRINYRLRVIVTSGDPDPAVFVFIPNKFGANRREADWSANNPKAREEVIDFTPPITGYYGIVVSNENNGEGEYSISLDQVKPVSIGWELY